MKDVEQKVKDHLSRGLHHSAIRTVVDAFKSSGGIERQKHKTLAELLLRNDEVKSALDEDLKQKIKTEDFLPGLDLKTDKYHFTGMAAFPVFNESGCRVAMLRCEQKYDYKLIDFEASPEVAGSFLTAANVIWQYVQKHIGAVEFPGNDVTVMNWGISFAFHYNPFESGRLVTPNLDHLEGDSFHFAALASVLSFITEVPVDPGFIFTGSFEDSGKMSRVSMLCEKTEVIRKERPGFRKIVIPHRGLFRGADRDLIENNPGIFLEIRSFDDFIEKIFGRSPGEFLRFEKVKRHSLGIARVIAEDMGVKQLTLFDRWEEQKVNERQKTFRVLNCTIKRRDANVKYNVFPCPRIYVPETGSNDQPTLILINFPSANTYLGNMMSNNGISSHFFAIGLNAEAVEAMIFACRTANEGWVIGKHFLIKDLEDK